MPLGSALTTIVSSGHSAATVTCAATVEQPSNTVSLTSYLPERVGVKYAELPMWYCVVATISYLHWVPAGYLGLVCIDRRIDR